jgi:hypothetical protein
MQLPNPGHALTSFKVVETHFQPHLNDTYSVVHIAEGSVTQKQTHSRSGVVEVTNTVSFGDIEPSDTNGGRRLSGIRRKDFANALMDLPLLSLVSGHLPRKIDTEDGPKPGYRSVETWTVPANIAFTAIGSDNYVILAVELFRGALTGETYPNEYRAHQQAHAG